MQIGDIVYLHIADIYSVLTMQQKLIDYRFGKVIEIKRVNGGKEDEQYLQYSVQSLLNPNKIYKTNNYLSPYKLCSLSELESAIKELDEIILPEQKDDIELLINTIKNL